MLKNIPYFLAVSLLTFSYTNIAEAGLLSKCTAALGKKGGKESHKCVTMSDPQEDPKFFKSFLENHCQKPIHPDDKRPCTIAKNKSAEVLTEEHVNTRDNDEDEDE